MKWYLFWEDFWQGLDKVSCWLWLHINIDYMRDRWAPMFCYRRECSIREKRWRKYPEHCRQRFIDDIARVEQERWLQLTRNSKEDQCEQN